VRKGEEEIGEEVGGREGGSEQEGWSVGGRDDVYRKKKMNERETTNTILNSTIIDVPVMMELIQRSVLSSKHVYLIFKENRLM
jgi:hypothetical protein